MLEIEQLVIFSDSGGDCTLDVDINRINSYLIDKLLLSAGDVMLCKIAR